MKKGFTKTELSVALVFILVIFSAALADFIENVRFYPISALISGSGVQVGSDSIQAQLYADSIVAYLPFDADSVTDYSGNHMQGTRVDSSSAAGISRSTTTYMAGSGSLYLKHTAGADSGYLLIPDILQNLRTTTQGTWSAWVKTGLVSDTITILSFSDRHEKEKVSLQIQPNGKVKAILMDSSGQGTGKIHWACSTSAAIDTTDWALITLTHNNTTPLLYIDGVLDTAKFMVSTSKTSWFDSLSMLDIGFIGCEKFDSSRHVYPFNGYIDEIIIEKEAWTADEIAAYFLASDDYNDDHASQPDNVSGYLYLPQFDPGYTAARRALKIQDMYAWLVLAMRAIDTTGAPPNIRWVVQGKDTTDANTWTDVSDTGYSHATVLGTTHYNDIDTLKGFVQTSIIERVPSQLRAVIISDTPNVAVAKWDSRTYEDIRFKTTE